MLRRRLPRDARRDRRRPRRLRRRTRQVDVSVSGAGRVLLPGRVRAHVHDRGRAARARDADGAPVTWRAVQRAGQARAAGGRRGARSTPFARPRRRALRSSAGEPVA